jgi:putative isomerase
MNRKQYGQYASLLREGMARSVPLMLQEPKGHLKHPYLDPSSAYSGQLWDWDQYFCSLALYGLLKDKGTRPLVQELEGKIVEHAKGSIRNFFEHQSPDGLIPTCILPDNPDVFQCRDRTKKDETNNAKPVLAKSIYNLMKCTGDSGLAREVFDGLLLHFEAYRRYFRDGETGLFVWGSDAAIGVDDDPTTWGRPNHSSANILLNCLMYTDLVAAAKIARTLGRKADEKKVSAYAKELKLAVNEFCWDPIDGFYYTVDVQSRRKMVLGWIHQNLEAFWKALPLKVKMWTGLMPLWAGIASPKQSAMIVKRHLSDREALKSDWGIRAVAKNEKMYQPEMKRANPSNWLGPIWINANYIAWEGLKRYGYKKEAEDIRLRIIELLGRDLQKTGTLHEYYSPETGKGVHNGNFWNWNNLVIYMLQE